MFPSGLLLTQALQTSACSRLAGRARKNANRGLVRRFAVGGAGAQGTRPRPPPGITPPSVWRQAEALGCRIWI